MSQIIENLTQIKGTLVARVGEPNLPDFDVVTVHVSETHSVEGMADLLSDVRGSEIDVEVRRDLLGDVDMGVPITLRAARTGRGTIMAEPHPDAEHFAVGIDPTV